MGLFRPSHTRRGSRWGATEVVVGATTTIHGLSPDEVWPIVRQPESALFGLHGCVKAYRQSGTGPGVGEEIRFVYDSNGVEYHRLVRVIVDDPPRTLETVSLSDTFLTVSSLRLNAVDEGTELSHTTTVTVPRGQKLSHWHALKQHAPCYVEGVRAHCEQLASP